MQFNRTTQLPIGGYLGLELSHGQEFYPDLLRLNTGRNALEYILRQRKYTKLYLPYFTCEVLLEPLVKLAIPYQFYHIDKELNPIIDFEIEHGAAFLYTNYFGIKQEPIKELSLKIKNLIVDNSQAFFSEPLAGVDTFYSCRKFFGVPDGSYLQIKRKINKKFPVDESSFRASHLLKSLDHGIEYGYRDYVENNKNLENNDIKTMSPLTKSIMSGINYEECAQIRERNYNFLHKHLKEYNLLNADIDKHTAPLVYPFLFDDKHLKVHLIQKKIFVATYWPNVFKWTNKKMFENYLAHNLVPLPIDQRYNLQDMFLMLNILKQLL
ncbi:hypothetical protein C8P68_104156 [Mucilaginibacter yixingensis]|uniref:DegT/DnrJ/EryC1/StrS aminotransferase family protein n=1 Tax=Mucilaginibacter yixingensis TaxID=1295612 RepID=A0A2T5J9C4_9SPHI|nr:hypothetical protein [Mucilaginibacter yixingensis]PTQ96670.1 hypothetical protein C8P68_104156 [Mucilaginibacter yixingensis]